MSISTKEMLKNANANMRNNKEFVLTAVSEDPFALEYASDELKNDKKSCLKRKSINRLSGLDS